MKADKMQKVMFFSAVMHGGGLERVISVLSNSFISKGIKVSVVTIEKAHENDYKLPNGVSRYGLSPTSKRLKIGVVFRLIDVIKKEKPDILVTMGVTLSIYTVLACKICKLPVVISERTDPQHTTAKKLVVKTARFLMRFANGYVFQTSGAQAFYKRMLPNIGIVIANPIDSHIYFERSNESIRKEIVTAGRLLKLKNHELLIKAFQKVHTIYPDYKLIIYGEGENRANLEHLIITLDLQDSVVLPGFVSDITTKICNASLFVLTSEYEGLPNALMEAMSLGLPVVSTDCPCGGPASLIEQNKNGLLIPVSDEKALVKAMCLILGNKDFAVEIGDNAAHTIQKDYSNAHISNIWCRYLESLI